jgi:iron complex transport system substrate-binding protein
MRRAHPDFARRRAPALLAGVFAGLFACVTPSAAAEGPRVASINVCSDQLLLALADPQQIVGLSPSSRNSTLAWAAAEASRFPRLSGTAEDVLMLHPDLVVAATFTNLATRELLERKGVPVVTFGLPRSPAEVEEQIRRMGELVGHPQRAAAAIARLDAALTRTRSTASRRAYRVLALSRRGWVSGSESLVSSLLAAVGLSNAAAEMGIKTSGFASLEAIVSTRPDLILVADDSPVAEDQGSALLLHPALEQLYPPDKRLVVPDRLTVCGGPMLAEALDRLTAELERVSR